MSRKVQRLVQKWSKGTLLEEDVKDFLDLTRISKFTVNIELEKEQRRHINRVKRRLPRLDEKLIMGALSISLPEDRQEPENDITKLGNFLNLPRKK